MSRPCDYDDGYDDEPKQWREPLPAREADVGPGWAPAVPLSSGARVAELLGRLRTKMVLNKACDSPIEIDLGTALVDRAKGRFKIVPQFNLPGYRYRYDFAILAEDESLVILVECDGAEFHSTAAQLSNDRAKDAAAISAGTRVIRVTGKQIYQNPEAWAAFIIGECSR